MLVPDFSVPDGKTASFVRLLNELGGGSTVLIVAESFTPETFLAARNVAPALLASAREVNTEQLLRYPKIIVTETSLPILAGRTQKA